MALVGPPEIYRTTTTTATTTTPAATGNPFIDQIVANFNKTALNTPPPPPMGYTENSSPTFLSTGNPCLDFFFHVVPPYTCPESLTQRLNSAWDHSPLTALKLVGNLRGVRGTGKSDKEGYYTAALWLHRNHPKTLACNVGPLAEFGCFKDLPEILYRILEAPEATEGSGRMNRINRTDSIDRSWPLEGPEVRREQKMAWEARKTKMAREARKSKKSKPFDSSLMKEAKVLAARKRMEIREAISELRKEKRIAAAKKAVERYNSNPEYKFLYDRISDLFADCLKSDIQHLRSNQLDKISHAAKWCPSLDSSFDKSTLLCEGVAKSVFPRDLYEEYEGVSEEHYAYRVRDRLRKEILVPLRKALELPEVYIGANQWGSIPYDRVTSVAMKLYKEKFRKHDKERFKEYLEKVKSGNGTIDVEALLPHDIIASLNDGDGGEVAELQWKRMVDDLSKKGKLKNCLAICHVSGSMVGIPMDVSIALGILVSELSEEPWKGKLITFSEKPTLQMILGEDLRSKMDFVSSMELGMKPDFQKVFDLILEVAVNGKLTEEQMIKRVFVFSDMEFDQASGETWAMYHGHRTSWETDYQAIVRKFGEKGYGTCVPEIVFWNLRDSKATPVPGNQKGVALVSGFSKNLMTVFLEESGVLNPEAVMEVAISGEEYKKLVVLD